VGATQFSGSNMEVHVHLKNAFPGGIGNRRIRFGYNLWFASHPSTAAEVDKIAQVLGCNNGGGGGNFSKIKRLITKRPGTRKRLILQFFGGTGGILETQELFPKPYCFHKTKGYSYFFWVTYITKRSTKSQHQITTNQPTNLKNSKLQRSGFFSKKKTIFGSKTKKIAANFCNRGIQTVRSRTFPTSPRIKRQKHTRRRNGEDESAAMIEGWNSKHLWKHVCMQAAREAVH